MCKGIRSYKLRYPRILIFFTFLLITILFSQSTLVFPHLCHDPFRPRKHLILSPETDSIKIERSGEFRIYIENTFQSILREVELLIENPAFDIKVIPPFIERLLPGERTFFLVKLKTKEDIQPQKYSLRISVRARSAELKPSIETLTVAVDEKIPEREEELVQLPAPPFEKLQPPKTTPEDIGEVTFEELQPPKTIPEDIGEVTVEIERIPFWKKPYFSMILIFLLLCIFLWRRIR